jgi:NAD+ synthase
MPGELGFDPAEEERRVVRFIRRTVAKADRKGAVVGLSGGVDSSVVGALCVEALGRERVLGALLPSRTTPALDVADARELAEGWGVELVEVGIAPAVDAVVAGAGEVNARLPSANVQARVRMTVLYYLANSRGLLVAGTGDRSEVLLGFFTKFGDGGADFLPIAHLFKTQVRAMALHLGIPERVALKPASPQLWPGHRAEEELPARYEELDPVLHLLFDSGISPDVASRRSGVRRSVVDQVVELHSRTWHKRALPPSLRPRRLRS